jgi:hypothetical protein
MRCSRTAKKYYWFVNAQEMGYNPLFLHYIRVYCETDARLFSFDFWGTLSKDSLKALPKNCSN